MSLTGTLSQLHGPGSSTAEPASLATNTSCSCSLDTSLQEVSLQAQHVKDHCSLVLDPAGYLCQEGEVPPQAPGAAAAEAGGRGVSRRCKRKEVIAESSTYPCSWAPAAGILGPGRRVSSSLQHLAFSAPGFFKTIWLDPSKPMMIN